VVVVGQSEATGRNVGVGERVDGARQAHPNWQHHGIPVGPTRAAENALILEVIVCNRKSEAAVILDVRVEERNQGRVAAWTGGRWVRTWAKARRARVGDFNFIELPVRGTSKSGIDGAHNRK